ncbi:aminotransferase class I/II-fold pyridoxal phosphate-dependent enzyme [uncultured Desulfobacter sp.]|uniref:aminotransferase class I/II-fold pyridoxal phosphate-dependent enzyme n=1 Tax=uncultured Desulfobacter sp. TaxID=240139 RepID=UPI0029C79F41|nr:aminotransferase class I/II-fold pyridoxal phosphate-dependent enzyme [uncultured Desulfobacter sp.]
MNPIAQELNNIIEQAAPHVHEMLSDMGKKLFFPKGILTQSAEAKTKADKVNATIGIAKQGSCVLSLSSVTKYITNIEPNDYLPYASSFGLPELRKKWRKEMYVKNPSLEGTSVSMPIVTSGITHGVSILSDMWVNANDVIVMPDMIWGNYDMIFRVRNSARFAEYKSYDDDMTHFNLEDFERVIREQAAQNDKIIVMLNFPHNPTGYTLSKKEAARVAEILIDVAQKGTNVVAACDDAYFGLFFEEESAKQSLFAKIAGKASRLLAIKLDGPTKEDYVMGFRTGFTTYAVAADSNLDGVYEALEKKTAGCIRGSISNCSHLSQTILVKSMEDENYETCKQEKFNLLKSRAFAIKEVLKDPKYADGFDVYPFNSGYYLCIHLKGVNADELRYHLLNNYGTGLISIGEDNLRVAFSCLEEKDVKTLFDNILSGINDLRT